MSAALPATLSLLRLLAAPLLAAAIVAGHWTAAVTLLAAACATDLVDGPLARRLGVASVAGAYLDVTADFGVALAGFGAFAWLGVYPWWTPFVLVFMFGQFLVTSRRGRLVYDPVGKYYGAFLLGAVGLSLVAQDLAVYDATLTALVVMTATSVASRVLALRRPAASQVVGVTGGRGP